MKDPIKLNGGPLDGEVIERPMGQYITIPFKLYNKEQTWTLNVLVTYQYTSASEARFNGVKVDGKGGFSLVPSADVNAKEASDDEDQS